jgi:hypothetical protein
VVFLGEEIPKREIPTFKVQKEQAEELRTVSAITKILAENPELTKEISDTFIQVRREAQAKLEEKVSGMIAEKLKDVPAEQIGKLVPYWYPWVIRYWYPWIIRYWQPWIVAPY